MEVLVNPTLVKGEVFAVTRKLTPLITRMALMESIGDPDQFHGWFPSDILLTLLSERGTPMDNLELNKAISAVQMFPAGPALNPHEAAPWCGLWKHPPL